jgi:hypothetical protein
VRPDLERDEEVGVDADQERHDGEEHHDRAVHADQRIVELGQDVAIRHHGLGKQPAARERIGRPGELITDQHGQQAAHNQEEQAQEEKLYPDHLVVGREDVFPHE